VEEAPWVAALAVEVAALVVGGSASRPLPVVALFRHHHLITTRAASLLALQLHVGGGRVEA